jgi:hypothetical protein
MTYADTNQLVRKRIMTTYQIGCQIAPNLDDDTIGSHCWPTDDGPCDLAGATCWSVDSYDGDYLGSLRGALIHWGAEQRGCVALGGDWMWEDGATPADVLAAVTASDEDDEDDES